MSTLNISIPIQLKSWINQQVNCGKYASASDYLRDLVREDIRQQERGEDWLANYLTPLAETADEHFVSSSAAEIKASARRKLKSNE